MKAHGTTSDPNAVLRAMRADGWTVELTSNQHLRCRAPSGALVFSSGRFGGKGSCPRALSNFLRDLHRIGGWTYGVGFARK